MGGIHSVTAALSPNCLLVSLEHGLANINEDTIANDQRVLCAGVSQEEARTYVRGVNDQVAKGARCCSIRLYWRQQAVLGGCTFLWIWLVIITQVGFYEPERLRCDARDGVCRGGDPLVDNCCVFWCCGNEMAGKRRELPARPYDRWDVWANRTYFNTTRCSINDKKFDGEKNDRDYKCTSCPAVRTKKVNRGVSGRQHTVKRGCRTMFEGRASHYRGTWWWVYFIVVASLFFVSSIASHFLYFIMVSRLYYKAFAEWRRRGIVTHIEFVPARGGQNGASLAYLRLFFPITSGADGTTGSNVVTTPSSPSMFTARVAPVVPVATMAPSTFTVQVPPDGSAGQTMQLQAPNGVILQVQIPFGCAAGSTFEVAMP